MLHIEVGAVHPTWYHPTKTLPSPWCPQKTTPTAAARPCAVMPYPGQASLRAECRHGWILLLWAAGWDPAVAQIVRHFHLTRAANAWHDAAPNDAVAHLGLFIPGITWAKSTTNSTDSRLREVGVRPRRQFLRQIVVAFFFFFFSATAVVQGYR